MCKDEYLSDMLHLIATIPFGFIMLAAAVQLLLHAI
jgi:hypothetical protein